MAEKGVEEQVLAMERLQKNRVEDMLMVNVPLLYLIVTKNFLLKRLLQNRLNLLYIVYVNY